MNKERGSMVLENKKQSVENMNQKIEVFDTNNIPQIVEVVKPMWSLSSWSEEFRQFDVEFIVRNNIFENEYALQLVDAENLLASIFAVTKHEKNNVDQWFLENSIKLTEQEKISVKMSYDYIKHMDSKVHALMEEDDIKLSLFVSCKKGFGSIVFDYLWKQLKNKGFKNMYLWTDCDCNWQWYLHHGFYLVDESIYGPFSDENIVYKTYVFRKSF